MLLTIKEVAERLRVKPATLYAWAVRGKIPCLKLNGVVRFSVTEIDAWVERGRRKIIPVTPRRETRKVGVDLKAYIATLRERSHNVGHGENRPKSGLIGKGEMDGAV